MTDTPISGLPAAAALTGTEIVPVVQGGDTVRATVQAIANLGGGASGLSFAAATVNGDGTILASTDNVASVTKNGTGDYTVNLTGSFPNVPGSIPLVSPVATLGDQIISAQMAGDNTVQVLVYGTDQNPQNGDFNLHVIAQA